MSGISIEDVQNIVRQERRPLEKTMNHLAISMDRMVNSITELTVQSKVTEEKFARVYDRIEDAQKLANEANKGLLIVTTEILPDLETKVAINAFSSAKMWKIAFIIAGPLIGGLWLVLKLQSQALIEGMKSVN